LNNNKNNKAIKTFCGLKSFVKIKWWWKDCCK